MPRLAHYWQPFPVFTWAREGMLASVTSNDEAQAMGRKQGKVQLRLLFLASIWCVVVGFGLSWLWGYEATPGEVVQSPTQWPAESRVERSPNQPTLIMFAHPRCPCTRASLSELELLTTHCIGRVDVCVLFYKPAKTSTGWEQTDLWASAQAIPGIKVVFDVDGSETVRFGATTSGYSLLYDRSGQLIFNGGITGSRGHSGDNAGRVAIESLVLNGESTRNHTFVFGCPILERDGTCDRGSN